LATALSWTGEADLDNANGVGRLNPLEREFLAESTRALSVERAVLRRRGRRRLQLVCLVVVLSLVATAIGLYAHQISVAAAEQARLASSRLAASQATRLREKDPAMAAQLALAAYRIAPTPEARAAVLDSTATPTPRRLRMPARSAAAMVSSLTVIAAADRSGVVQLWRTAAGSPVLAARIDTGTTGGMTLALSQDSTLLAAAVGDSVRVWRIADLDHPGIIATARGQAGTVRALAVRPDLRAVAVGTDAGVGLWDLRTNTFTRLDGPGGPVRTTTFTHSGRVLAAGSDDATVHLWDAESAAHLATLSGPTSQVWAVDISPDDRVIAAGSAGQHQVYLWDIAVPAQPASLGAPLTGPNALITGVAFSPDGTTVAAVGIDTRLWRWDLRTRRVSGSFPHPITLASLSYRDNQTIDTLADDGIVRTWPTPGPVIVENLREIYSVSFSADDRRLLVGGNFESMRLLDVTRPTAATAVGPAVTNELPAAPFGGASVLTPDGTLAFAGSNDGTLHLWDFTDSAHPRRIGAPLRIATDIIEATVLSDDATRLAVSSDDRTVHLLDVTDPRQPRPLSTIHVDDKAYGVRFSPDGTVLAVATGNGKGYLWDIRDVANPRALFTVAGFHRPVYAVAFSPDGSLAAFGGADYTVQLVELTDRARPRLLDPVLSGPVGEVNEISFHPHTRQLAVSSIDGSIWLWDLTDPGHPRNTGTLTANGGHGLLTVFHSHSGQVLAAAGRDNILRFWLTDPDRAVRAICATAGYPITAEEWTQFIPEIPYTPTCID
jgi:WD40 repeat protein